MKSHGRDTDPATVLSVTKMKLWVIAGVIGAASVAAVPAIDAYAYPPGTSLQVSVTPTANPHEYIVSGNERRPRLHLPRRQRQREGQHPGRHGRNGHP